ncbi:hypothetical protein U14_02477 [Candidatus Moduliflexus flocculans]|uniref:Uncharacterized protein n=1 Tax=Candidatus Moduliflexus flocculans TaxID=1499966 RepID=A0A081BLG8_9BACT|nr:hypothetical protein U14_02477 [Candidatus Moduliflexus flocculans]
MLRSRFETNDRTLPSGEGPSWEGQGVGSSVSDCSCQEPTPNPSPEGSVRSFVSNRLRNMSNYLAFRSAKACFGRPNERDRIFFGATSSRCQSKR